MRLTPSTMIQIVGRQSAVDFDQSREGENTDGIKERRKKKII